MLFTIPFFCFLRFLWLLGDRLRLRFIHPFEESGFLLPDPPIFIFSSLALDILPPVVTLVLPSISVMITANQVVKDTFSGYLDLLAFIIVHSPILLITLMFPHFSPVFLR